MNAGTGVLTKPLMFVSAYAPLFVLLALRFDGATLRAVCAVLAVLGVIAAGAILRLHRGTTPGVHVVREARLAGTEASAFLAGYLLPFLTVSQPTGGDLAAYALFIVVAGIVHVRTGIIQVNPTLFCLGWTILALVDDQGGQYYLVTRHRYVPGDTLQAVAMGDDVLLERPPATEQPS
ncbi:hypothetical protein [Flexivirga caeni]|uniref:Uncharacterized protein n=1 Tax=Flexivirga caeni TaxID=2294115 RepID=A0A3M9MHS8_9MICO|nr:hypothetical protein [Flexivirga caeni]RNI25086.1 hypothetical protein EFY87_00040 [Flexivirga caeni]